MILIKYQSGTTTSTSKTKTQHFYIISCAQCTQDFCTGGWEGDAHCEPVWRQAVFALKTSSPLGCIHTGTVPLHSILTQGNSSEAESSGNKEVT